MPHDPNNHHFQNIAGFGVKKSDFNDQGATAFDGTATIDVVINGVNKKQTIANFFANAGTTVLSPVGGAGAIPVLEQFVGAANVRGLESGPGVLVSMSAGNGITIRENLIADSTGFPVLRKEETSTTVRSLLPGVGIGLETSGNTITISSTGVIPVPPVTKTVVIFQESDFPDPELGIITLDADTDYFIANDVITANTFRMGDRTQIRSVGAKIISLTYTGTGTMFESIDATAIFHRIALFCVQGTFIYFEDTDDVENINSLIITECDIHCLNGGSFEDGHTFLMAEVNFPSPMANGFEFLEFNIRLSVTEVNVQMATNTFLLMPNASFDTIQIENNNIVLNGTSVFLEGDTDSDNLHTNGSATVVGNIIFTNVGIPLVTVTPDDDQWNFSANNKMRDTSRDVALSFQNNAAVTTIVALNTPVKVNSVWTTNRISGFTALSNGEIRYRIKNNDLAATITVSISAHMDGVNNTEKCTFYLAIGQGSPLTVADIVPNSGMVITLDSDEVRSGVIVWDQILNASSISGNTDDRLEVWVEQNEGTIEDIIVEASVFRIS